ncbi:HisA/HisF-related TIM barrel protein [Aliikangiella maris]|uniref:HisA/HisF-related TIM barrel protein n=2 Tax=Aliikangiella maris TaxID=3162458 RepID=A0ABV3MS18_9GAMM
MQLVPVLEIRHGKCVHTLPKKNSTEQIVKENLLEVVERLVDSGITRFHIVDVDAIASGEPENVDLIEKIKIRYPTIQLQLIGGINSVDAAFVWIDAGVDYLVLNSKSVKRKNLLDDICLSFPNKVLVELDCCQFKQQGDAILELLQRLDEDGVAGIVMTDIGATTQIVKQNIISICDLIRHVELPIFINGGIENTQDVAFYLSPEVARVDGILISKVLYSNAFSLTDANEVIKTHQLSTD